jgi:IS5 family transposase
MSWAERASWTGRVPAGQLERARQTGGCLTGPNPTDRGKPGSKYQLVVDRCGIPLALGLSAANTHDSVLLEPMVDAVPPVKGPRGRPGRPRQRPVKLHGDKGYDYPRCRLALRRRGITPRIARRGIESS